MRTCKMCGKQFKVDKYHLSQLYCDECKCLRYKVKNY